MSWRTLAIIMIAIFAMIAVQSVLADPLVETASMFNATGDHSTEFYDGNSLITNLPGAWLNMGLIFAFGLMAYGIGVVVRRELTRGQL